MQYAYKYIHTWDSPKKRRPSDVFHHYATFNHEVATEIIVTVRLFLLLFEGNPRKMNTYIYYIHKKLSKVKSETRDSPRHASLLRAIFPRFSPSLIFHL